MSHLDNEEIQRFLTDVTNQIAYKPLHGGIKKELEDQTEDRVEEYRFDGTDEVWDQSMVHGR